MNKLKTVCTVALFFIAWSALAQSRRSAAPLQPVPDTIYVYDTIRVTDTIRIPRHSAYAARARALEPLPRPNPTGTSAGQNFLIISEQGAATFLPESILDSVLHFQKPESMKKIGFFTVVWFAFQNLVPAQNSFYLQAGTGAYRMFDNHGSKANIAASFSAGIGYRRALFANRFSIGAACNFQYQFRSDFDSSGLVAQGLPTPLNIGEDFSRRPFLVHVPVSIAWNTKRVCPFIGMEYYHKSAPHYGPVVDDNGVFETKQYRTPFNGAGWLCGADLPISARWSASVTYFHGLTTEKKISYNGILFDSKMQRLELQLHYRFH